jgi:hypothetical protein
MVARTGFGIRLVSISNTRSPTAAAPGDRAIDHNLRRLKGKIAELEERLGDRLSRESRDPYH